MNNLWDIIKESKDYENLNESTFFNSIIVSMPSELDHFVALAKQSTNVKSTQDLMTELTNHYVTRRGSEPTIMNVTVGSDSEAIDEECGFCKSNNLRPFNNHSVKSCRKVKSLKLNNDDFKPTNIIGRARAIGIPEDKSQAILDTGATTTVTGRRDLFTSFRKLENKPIVTAGGIVNATGIGTINVELKAGRQTMTWSISDTLYIPSLEVTLISTAKLKMKKLKLLYEPHLGKATICDAYTNAIWEVPLIDNIIAFKIVNPLKMHYDSIYSIGKQDKITFYHAKLGHLNEVDLRHMLKRLYNIKFDKNEHVQCDPCTIGKSKEKPFEGKLNKAKQPLEIIHSDIAGPINTGEEMEDKYFITFIDEFTRFNAVSIIGSKSDAFAAFVLYHNTMTNIFDKRIKFFHCDRGKEYISNQFKDFLQTNGIVYNLTSGYAPQSNGIAERFNRTLQDDARTMLNDAKLPSTFWPFAILHSSHTRNRLPHSHLKRITPFEKLTGEKPKLDQYTVFGCKVMVHIPAGKRHGKFEAHSKPGIFLGYPFDSNGFHALVDGDVEPRCYRSGKFYESEVPGYETFNKSHRGNLSTRGRNTTPLAQLGGPDHISILQPIDAHEVRTIELEQAYNNEAQEDINDNLDEVTDDQLLEESDKSEEISYHNEAQEDINDNLDEVTDDQIIKESDKSEEISYHNEAQEDVNDNLDEVMDDQIIEEPDKSEETSYNNEAQEAINNNLNEMTDDQVNNEPNKTEENSFNLQASNNETQEESNNKIDEPVNDQVNNKPKEREDINNIDEGNKTNNQTENIDIASNNDYAGNQSVNQLKRKDSPVQRPSPSKKQIIVPGRAREERIKELKRQQYENAYLVNSNNDIVIPKSYEHAMKLIDSQQWITASQEELKNHDRNDTWTLIDKSSVPNNKKIIGCRWVYNRKIDANNEPTIYKARLVAQGFSQIPGLDYEETAAPVTTLVV